MSTVTGSSCNYITISDSSSSDVGDVIEVSDSDTAPTVDSARCVDSLKRQRSDDEVEVVSEPKRSTFKTPLFDSESSDVDDSAASPAPTQASTVDSAQSVKSSKRPRSDDEVVSKPKRVTFKTPLFEQRTYEKPLVDTDSSDDDDSAASPAPTQAPTVDSAQSAESLKRPRSDDEVDVSKPKRSTFRTPLFDSESSDVDTAAPTQAPTETSTQSVPTVVTSVPKVDRPRMKELRKCKRDVDEFNYLCIKAEYHDINLNIQPFASVCEVFNRLKLLSDSDDEGEDVFSDYDDDTEDDVDDVPNSHDEEFIDDGSDHDVDTHDDGDITGEEGVNTRNIIYGRRQRNAPERYIREIEDDIRDLLLADVPPEERRFVFGSTAIHSD